MAINEAVNIGINVDGTASVKDAANAYEDLGDAVAKTQLEAERLANTYGINDQRTQEAIKVAGKYKQQMEELDFAIDGARGGVDQMFRATQGIVAGFEVAAGAAALFGGENEELEKTLMKVQGAMVFAQGLKDLKEFSPAIKGVASGFSGILTKAVQGFSTAAKAAMAATGIGLIVVAVGTLVSYWDSIKELVNGVSGEQKDLLETQKQLNTLAEEQIDSISIQENILKQQGKTEKDILNMKIAATKNAIAGLEAQLLTQEQIKQSQIETAKRNQNILSGILKFISLPIAAILKAVDALRNAFGGESDLVGEFFSGLERDAASFFDAEGIAEEADKGIAETNKQLTKLKNSVAGYEMQVTNIQKEAANKRKAQRDKEAAEEQKRIDDKRKADEEAAKKAEEERLKQLEDEEFALQAWIEYDTERAEAEIANAEYVAKRKKEIADQELKDQEAKAEKERQIQEETFKTINNLIELSNAFLSNQNSQLNEDFQNRIDQLKELGYSEEEISNMRDAELQKIDERAKRNFEIQKNLQYAQTLLSTIQGTQESFTSANKSPLTAIFPAYPYLQAAAAAAFGLAQLQQISQSSYKSKLKPATSGRGGSGGNASVPNFQAPRVQLGVGGEQFTQANRVYVTEADISNTQNKVKVTEGISSF